MVINLKKCFIKYKRFIPLYGMMIPGIAYIWINNYVPLAGLRIAFQNFNYAKGISGSPYVGLKNFEFLFATSDAFIITRNTICYNTIFIIIGTLVAIAVAILLSEITAVYAKKFYQTAILVPFLISMVVVSYLVFAFLSADTGFINKSILEPLGLPTVTWYSTIKPWPIILVIVNIWKGFGYNSIIYYATLMGIDQSYYEAAAIDGATRWQRIKHITIPSLNPTIITLTLMAIGRVFYSDFGLFYQVPMNSGILIPVTNTIDTYVYRGLFTLNNISMAAAAGVYQSLVGFILVLVANFIVKKINSENALF
ncbi:MAG: ABC transporter permease subunit [Eubacteriales bacterium]